MLEEIGRDKTQMPNMQSKDNLRREYCDNNRIQTFLSNLENASFAKSDRFDNKKEGNDKYLMHYCFALTINSSDVEFYFVSVSYFSHNYNRGHKCLNGMESV